MLGVDKMQKTSISFHVGKKTSIAHNNRENIHGNPDIDPTRIKDNITYKREDIKDVYSREFDDAVKEFNDTQKRKDRHIKDYYSKMLNDKKTNHQNEIIVQIGKHNDGIDWDTKKEILDKYAKEFQAENPNLKVYNSVMHLDEASPHLHINYVPVAENEKKTGMKKIVSQNSAMEKMSLTGAKKKHAFDEWANNQREKLTKMMSDHNLERVKEGSRKHYDVDEYKEMQEDLKVIRKENQELKNENQELKNEMKDKKTDLKKIEKDVAQVEKKLEVRSEVLKEVNNLDKVQPEKKITGGIQEKSYEEMRKTAKGAVATRDKYKDVAKERGEVIEKQKAEIAKLKSNANRMSENNVELRNENQSLKKELGKMNKFLEKFNLTEKFKAFTKLLEKALDVVKAGEKERER